MEYVKTKLANGIRVIVVPMPALQSVTVTIWVGTGSRYENTKINGISHFLEHMVFKGGSRFKTSKAVSLAVDSFGGEFNAGTSKEWTNFYIRSHKDNVKKAFEVLTDIVFSPRLKASDLERERGVILEEMSMNEDDPQGYVWDVFERLFFQGSNLAKDILGTREVIKNLNVSDFLAYQDAFYYPDNIVVTVSGGVDSKRVLTLVNSYVGHIKAKKAGNKSYKPFKKIQKAPRVSLLTQKREQTNFIIGFYGSRFDSEDVYPEILLEILLGSGTSSRLWREIREKRGMSYSVGATFSNYIDTGYVCGFAGVEPKRATQALKVMLDEFYKLTGSRHGLKPKEMTKAKEYFKGHFALSQENTLAVNSFLGKREMLTGKIKTHEEVIAGIEKVTIDDVLAVANKRFIPKYANLAVIGPHTSSVAFEQILK